MYLDRHVHTYPRLFACTNTYTSYRVSMEVCKRGAPRGVCVFVQASWVRVCLCVCPNTSSLHSPADSYLSVHLCIGIL